MPVRASWAGRRASPPSTTIRTPSTVSDVSAMSVASTTRRRPGGAGARARSCSAAESDPWRARTSTPRPARSARAAAARSISPAPGRKARTSPSSASRARRTPPPPRSTTSGRHVRPRRDERDARRPPHVDREGPALGLHDRRVARGGSATLATSRVADMARIRRSGRSDARASMARARPRSVTRWRSCTSSNTTSAVPGSVGSDCSRRVRIPSVTTSSRVDGPTRRSSRVR